MNSKLGSQQTKVPLAAALSPFMSLLYPPNLWCEWCDVWRLTTSEGSTSPTLFEQWCRFFYVLQEPEKYKIVLWDGTYSFSSLFKKTRKSKHLQMSLQRQHFLLSNLKTLSVGPAMVKHNKTHAYTYTKWCKPWDCPTIQQKTDCPAILISLVFSIFCLKSETNMPSG